MLQYNLQLFAKDGPGGEKTEQPTAKKLSDARKEGQVAKSKEITMAISLLFMFVFLKIYVGSFGTKFLEIFHATYNKIPDFASLVAGGMPIWDMAVLFRQELFQMMLMMAPFFLIALGIGIGCEVYQVRWEPTGKPLAPKFNKMNPINGVKRIFSLNSLMELLKSVGKVLLIGFVVYSSLKKNWRLLFSLLDMDLFSGIEMMGNFILNTAIKICAVYLVIGFIDLFYQKWKFKDDMKMTKQEVKDEFKQSEGDPQIKGKIRQRMMQASRRRMMQDLATADVVITNPTHFAVAIKYDANLYDAPFVVAKGCDHLAAKIKESARENKIEIVENKPLARMLYYNVEIGSVIPPELYKAVADILAYVYKLQGKV